MNKETLLGYIKEFKEMLANLKEISKAKNIFNDVTEMGLMCQQARNNFICNAQLAKGYLTAAISATENCAEDLENFSSFIKNEVQKKRRTT